MAFFETTSHYLTFSRKFTTPPTPSAPQFLTHVSRESSKNVEGKCGWGNVGEKSLLPTDINSAIGQWARASEDFFESFRNYDEAGSPQRIQVLKYLVLANMLTGSEVNPFDSQETKP